MRVVAILGTYRRRGTTDQAVEAILEGARVRGAETSKIYLADHPINFCRNCRACTQDPGPRRGKCVERDELESIQAHRVLHIFRVAARDPACKIGRAHV